MDTAELNRLIANIVRTGKIWEVQAGLVRVEFSPELQTDWLQYFVPFAGGKPSGPPVDVLTGFLSAVGNAYGRPVGVAVDKTGALMVADDVGNIVWRVSAK